MIATRKPPAELEADNQWWEIPARWLEGRFVIRLLEPAGTSVIQLMQRLRSGRYEQPFVLDDGEVRRLQFGLRYAQSEMRLDAPYALSLPYTQSMMAFLLFRPQPKEVVVVGLGGGSLTKFCYRQLSGARVTSIEIDARVIALGTLFEMPAPDRRLRLVHADAAAYFSGAGEACDVVLLDGCDKRGVAPAFRDESFYRRLRTRLRRGGMLVVNLIGSTGGDAKLLEVIGEVFDGRVLVLNVAVGGNRIAFVFRDAGFPPDWPAVRRRARRLAEKHGLEFLEFARKLERFHRLQPTDQAG